MTKYDLQLNTASIVNVPLQTYQEEFTFIVNGKRFQTTRLISDLLSPKISRMHAVDPTIETFCITTTQKGDFSYLLKLSNFQIQSIPDDILPFVSEVSEILEMNNISLHENLSEPITSDNVFPSIYAHEKSVHLYRQKLEEEIEYIASHFYEIASKNCEQLKNLKYETLEQIISSENLVLNDEDQLIDFVNQLCEKDREFTSFYATVYFERVASGSISNFLNLINEDDITKSTWRRICDRLIQEVKTEKTVYNEKRYNKRVRSRIEKPFTSNGSFNGIINHLKSNGRIDDEITLTSSSNNHQNNQYSDIHNIISYCENKSFWTKDVSNSWICIEFKHHKIIPTYYTIKTCYDGSPYPRSWAIEACNDGRTWEVIDEQKDCSPLNDSNRVHSFKINEQNQKEISFVRIRQTQTWSSSNCLGIGSLEIFGTIV